MRAVQLQPLPCVISRLYFSSCLRCESGFLRALDPTVGPTSNAMSQLDDGVASCLSMDMLAAMGVSIHDYTAMQNAARPMQHMLESLGERESDSAPVLAQSPQQQAEADSAAEVRNAAQGGLPQADDPMLPANCDGQSQTSSAGLACAMAVDSEDHRRSEAEPSETTQHESTAAERTNNPRPDQREKLDIDLSQLPEVSPCLFCQRTFQDCAHLPDSARLKQSLREYF